MSSKKRQTSIENFIKGKRKPKEIDPEEVKSSKKKLKAGKTKGKNMESMEETKEVKKSKKTTKIKTDYNSDPLNSYEDFVAHLGDWQEPLSTYLSKPHYKSIYDYVKKEYESTLCFPPKELIFNAFKKAPFKDVNVVIVGQDPYIKVNEAIGLCFSVPRTTKCPPSLKNIYKALKKDKNVDFKEPKPPHGDLEKWADQGILMLNAALTVREKKSFSHAKSGWLEFTRECIKAINREKEGVIFLCWGGKALQICKDVDKSKHHILSYGHPSPLAQASMKFENCPHFSQTNKILREKGMPEIDWNVD